VCALNGKYSSFNKLKEAREWKSLMRGLVLRSISKSQGW
jgi:hypothetical protein